MSAHSIASARSGPGPAQMKRTSWCRRNSGISGARNVSSRPLTRSASRSLAIWRRWRVRDLWPLAPRQFLPMRSVGRQLPLVGDRAGQRAFIVVEVDDHDAHSGIELKAWIDEQRNRLDRLP